MSKLTHSTDEGWRAIEVRQIEKEGCGFYREFSLSFDPPPIPVRVCDWHAIHKDYDGPEDGRFFHGPSVSDLLAQIDDYCDDAEAA
jgi:hypothetical protein